jgi:adenylate cyclase class 2
MNFEVEQKFRVVDLDVFRRKLDEQGVKLGAAKVQIDRYFNHPARDFAQTDEALRIRSISERNFVTYKGPKIDATTKTRREIELPLDSGKKAADSFAELLVALGFRPVAEVKKQRRSGVVHVDSREVELAYDEVDEVGTFVELECLAEEADLAAAKDAIATVAADLALKQSERRSYLELLLAARRGNA